jgi:dihydrofolate reductase
VEITSLRQIGTHIMGRVTYEQMAAHRPSATDSYAKFMNDIPKVVFSTTQTVEWTESRIARGDLAQEITGLKRESGGDIMTHGGATFVQALSKLGLIDEYRLVIRPVALSNGLPLFKDLPNPLPLQLLDDTTYPDGTAIHVYQHTRSA